MLVARTDCIAQPHGPDHSATVRPTPVASDQAARPVASSAVGQSARRAEVSQRAERCTDQAAAVANAPSSAKPPTKPAA